MINKKIVYLTSSHYATDDRIYYHIKETLERNGYDVFVLSSYGDTEVKGDRILSIEGAKLSKSKKIDWFYEQLKIIEPNIMICGEPLPILAAKKHKKKSTCKIIYDVTEWYPSKKNLENLSIFRKVIKASTLLLFNLYASFFVDGFIIGEYFKKKIYDVFFPLKPKTIISYYVNKKYISLKPKKLKNNEFVIGYSGRFSREKGIDRVFKVADVLRIKNPNKQIKLMLIGKAFSEEDKLFFENIKTMYPDLKLEIESIVPFEKFHETILNFDVALDLRDNDWENTRCLPIKVFHYNGCGIPIVYSSLKAIKKDYLEASFCELIEPDNIVKGVSLLQKMIDKPEYYYQISIKAVENIEQRYLWEGIEKKVVDFIQKFD